MSRRRGRGEGLIRQRADGRWEARVSAGYANGKRVFKAYYGATRSDVGRKLAKALREQQQGLPLLQERQRLEQFLSSWLTEVVKPSLRPRTHQGYAQVVERHINPHIGKRVLSRLTPQDLQHWLGALRDSGISPRTCRYARTVLRAALGHAQKLELVVRNVATLVAAPKYVRPRRDYLTLEQARALLDSAKGEPIEALLVAGIGTGLRIGELLALSWTDVDLTAHALTVRRTLSRAPVGTKDNGKVRTELVLGEPKSLRSRRTIPIPASVSALLVSHRARQREQAFAVGLTWRARWPIFATPLGTHRDYANVRREFRALALKAQLPDATLHDLRHAHASLALLQGVDLRTISETLGHSQISVTADFYAHVLPQLQRSAADKMNALLVGS